MQDPEAARPSGRVLAQLAAAIRIYGALAVTGAPGQDQLTAELERYLDAAQDQQDRLSELLGHRPCGQAGRLAAAGRADQSSRPAQE